MIIISKFKHLQFMIKNYLMSQIKLFLKSRKHKWTKESQFLIFKTKFVL